MPTKILDYVCSNCEHRWEFLAHLDDDVPECCPHCGSENFIPAGDGGHITTCHDPKVLEQTLKKRSADHTVTELKKLAGHKGTLPPNFGRRGGPTIK